ncbi:MAG: NAD(P)H-dependent oxidoreductase subunit E [Mariprofundaceae bacterium]|nr:NAD(P)H-dependent oxidoreductase subunit E [Mariprofundaceae bacterium]
MSESFLHYIQKTYPAKKAYALAALQDAQSMLKNSPPEDMLKLRDYFQTTPKEWAKLQNLVYKKEVIQAQEIHICTGPICTNNRSHEISTKTDTYIKKNALNILTVKTKCQAKCHQSPVVHIGEKTFSPCQEESLFHYLDKIFD